MRVLSSFAGDVRRAGALPAATPGAPAAAVPAAVAPGALPASPAAHPAAAAPLLTAGPMELPPVRPASIRSCSLSFVASSPLLTCACVSLQACTRLEQRARKARATNFEPRPLQTRDSGCGPATHESPPRCQHDASFCTSYLVEEQLHPLPPGARLLYPCAVLVLEELALLRLRRPKRLPIPVSRRDINTWQPIIIATAAEHSCKRIQRTRRTGPAAQSTPVREAAPCVRP